MNKLHAPLALAAVASAVVACAAQPAPQAVDAALDAMPCPVLLVRGHEQFPDAPASTLVPDSPADATACRYAGPFDPKPDTLTRSVRLPGAQAEHLAAALDSAGEWPPGAVYNCPSNDGESDIVVFDYAHRGPVVVLVATSGCQDAFNGHRRTVGSGLAVAQLSAIVGSNS
jgi:hypothetical protein